MATTAVLTLFLCMLWRLRCPRPPTDVLVSRYGRPTLNTYRKLEKLDHKIDKLRHDISFLQRCREYGIIPKFLKFKIYDKNFNRTETYKEWQNSLLMREIRVQTNKLNKLMDNLVTVKNEFRRLTSFLDYWVFYLKIKEHTKYISSKIELRHENKLKNLGIQPIVYNENSIFNFSSHLLKPREKKLLALGLDFGIPFYKSDWMKHFLALEKLLGTVSSCTNLGLLKDGLDPAKLLDKVKDMGASNFDLAKKMSKSVWSSVLKLNDLQLLKALGKDKSLVISKPDKGKGVVLLDKKDYVEKMNTILKDKSKFRKSNVNVFDYIVKLEDKLNRILRTIKDKIGEEIYNWLHASGSGPGIMYGLPKVHKVNVPLRPIVSCIKTAAYNLSKFLSPIVSPLATNQYTLPNSKAFVTEIAALNLPSNFIMASLDVESLFTNVPLNETIEIILDKYDPKSFYDICKDTVRKLLKFATSESCFLFDGSLFNQIDGISMGSCLGPLFANAFLCSRETSWLDNCPSNFKPLYYRRYVDDLFLIFNNDFEVDQFLGYMNKQHNNIKFTCEREVEGRLAFLDVLVSKTENGITTGVYRKNTFTGQGLNWFSFTPYIYKINSIRTLLTRAYDVCSSFLLLHEEILVLRKYFLNNNYSLDLFERILKKFLYDKMSRVKCDRFEVPRLVKYIKLPFYGSVSYKFKDQLLKTLSTSFPAVNFKVVFTNDFKVGSFFSFKDKIPDLLCSDIVYQFTCAGCQARYIGCSSRAFKIRIFEHMGKSYRSGRFLQTMSFSAIRNHSRELDHPFDFGDFKIISKFRCHSDALYGEKLLIQKIKPELNTSNNS